MRLGVDVDLQEHLGAGDVAFDRLCGELSDDDLEARGSSYTNGIGV